MGDVSGKHEMKCDLHDVFLHFNRGDMSCSVVICVVFTVCDGHVFGLKGIVKKRMKQKFKQVSEQVCRECKKFSHWMCIIID